MSIEVERRKVRVRCENIQMVQDTVCMGILCHNFRKFGFLKNVQMRSLNFALFSKKDSKALHFKLHIFYYFYEFQGFWEGANRQHNSESYLVIAAL